MYNVCVHMYMYNYVHVATRNKTLQHFVVYARAHNYTCTIALAHYIMYNNSTCTFNGSSSLYMCTKTVCDKYVDSIDDM